MKEINLTMKGKLYCSCMPYSDFDYKNVFYSYIQNNINKVINLTEEEECKKICGKDLHQLYKEHNIEEINFPIEDFNIPANKEDVKLLISCIINSLLNGDNVAIHCHAGIGRTGVILALILKTLLKINNNLIINETRKYIRNALVTEEQEAFVTNF